MVENNITPFDYTKLNSRTEPLQTSSSAQENVEEQNDTENAKDEFEQSDRSSSAGHVPNSNTEDNEPQNAKENGPKRARITFRKFAVRHVKAPIPGS